MNLQSLEQSCKMRSPRSYLRSIPLEDPRWNKVIKFWGLSETQVVSRILNRHFRKQRSSQLMIAIMEESFCKGNITIAVDDLNRIIMFSYRGSLIGEYHQEIMAFVPVHAGKYEGSHATIGQRQSAKSAIKEVVQSLYGDIGAQRISLAYQEFLIVLFGFVPRQPSELWVSRESYVKAMNIIEKKYKLAVGDEDFLEWRLTLIGRSPMLNSEETKERA